MWEVRASKRTDRVSVILGMILRWFRKGSSAFSVMPNPNRSIEMFPSSTHIFSVSLSVPLCEILLEMPCRREVCSIQRLVFHIFRLPRVQLVNSLDALATPRCRLSSTVSIANSLPFVSSYPPSSLASRYRETRGEGHQTWQIALLGRFGVTSR